MKRFLTFLFAICISVFSYAQSEYTRHMLQGNVKYNEGLYEEAISFYQRAITSADAPADISSAKEKIAQCKKKIAERNAPRPRKSQRQPNASQDKPAESSTPQKTPNTPAKVENPVSEPAPAPAPQTPKASHVLVGTFEYAEPGIYFLEIGGEWKIQDDVCSEPSFYTLKIYEDEIRVETHIDLEGAMSVVCPSGTVIKLTDEDDNYRLYSSGKDEESFAVSKKPFETELGSYYHVYRVVGNKRIPLISEVEVKMLDMNRDDASIPESAHFSE